MAKLQDPEGIEMKAVLKHLSFDGKDVLEIGCGDGRLTFKYAEMARRVVAIDPSRRASRKPRVINQRIFIGGLSSASEGEKRWLFPTNLSR